VNQFFLTSPSADHLLILNPVILSIIVMKKSVFAAFDALSIVLDKDAGSTIIFLKYIS